MSKWVFKWGRWLFPVIGCIVLFLFIHVLQKFGGLTLPALSKGALAAVCGITFFGYLLQLKILNRIGGWAVVFVAAIIVVATLLPKETMNAYPGKASVTATEDFDSAWKAIYGKDLFSEFSLHENLMQYLESLARFDIHRAGQIGLFGLFGIALGICFLFPIDPSKCWNYGGRVLLLLLVGFLWSLQLELLQVLSPTRPVSFTDFIESLIGVTGGVLVFALFNIAYITRKKSLADRRFNILGVGIDAVNMDDCLDLFEEIIGDKALGTGHEAVGTAECGSDGVEECGETALECGDSSPLSDQTDSSAYAYPSQDETGSLDLGGKSSGMGVSESGSKG
ncbi:hypothetical protein P4B35_15530, partial [Pontiellaceae bacterium B12227]|nr:hypothetical protein [Pontiellaceae bacterium B12227]